MLSEPEFELCNSLVNGFHEALSDEVIRDLYNKLPRRARPSYRIFKTKSVRCNIVNKLLQTKYAVLFTSMDDNQIAKVLGLSYKEYAVLLPIIARKLQLLKISSSLVEDTAQLVDEIYNTAYTIEIDNDSSEDME